MSSERPAENLAVPKRGWQGIFNSLGIRDFRIYWLGLITLFFANQLQLPAQAWLAYELTHSPLELTLVVALQSVPMILLTLYSGVIIDRIQKRNIIIISHGFTVAVSAVIAVLIATGHIQYWHLLLASLLTGISRAFNNPARNAITAELVPNDKLYNAIALGNAGSNAAAVAGPAISGILISMIGVQGAYYAGIGFLIIGIFIISLLPATSKLGHAKADPVMKNLIEGLHYLRARKAIIILLIMEMALTLFGMSYQGLIPVFADLLKADSAKYGFMLAATGIGAMAGSLGVASLGNFKRKGLVMLFSGVVFGISLVLFSNTGRIENSSNPGLISFYLAMVLLVAIGLFSNSYTSTSNTVVQMNVDNEFRGRMTSFYSLVVGFYPISTLIVGALAQGIGASLAVTITGSCLVLFMLTIAFTSSRIRRLE